MVKRNKNGEDGSEEYQQITKAKRMRITQPKRIKTPTKFYLQILWVFYVMATLDLSVSCNNGNTNITVVDTTENLWHGWNHYQIKETDTLERYGYNLISNTAYFLGPKGSVSQTTNGMNCQNCHLEAGILPWGNNYSAVAATYPKFRDRSNSIESIEKRVNECLERSLNGKAINSSSREMKAFIAYIKWVGNDVPKGKKPKGSGIMDIPFLDRAANAQNGKKVYVANCQRCHQTNGDGQKNAEGYGYTYPPLWGSSSYNTGAGLYRLSRLAGYVKNNMPFKEATYNKPILTNEEAWDVAAFINSQPRPIKDISKDWYNIAKKPIDHPFAPYADSFTEIQHKYGPFQKILAFKKMKL